MGGVVEVQWAYAIAALLKRDASKAASGIVFDSQLDVFSN
jgi:hypothetical protein